MRVVIGLGIALVVASGLLYWQIQRNGELSAEIEQKQAAIEQLNATVLKEREKSAKTHLQLAESRKKVQQLQQSERELSHDLQESNSECVNARIPTDIAERVRQFRDSNN